MSEIKHTYDGIEIEYLEALNKWQFTLRGRERIVDSLAEAKAAIDKPTPVKKPDFERIRAYYRPSYSYGKYEVVEVTSIAAQGHSWRSVENGCVWIVDKQKERNKVDVQRVFPVNEWNSVIIQKVEKLQEEEATIRKAVEGLEKTLRPLKLPKEDLNAAPG